METEEEDRELLDRAEVQRRLGKDPGGQYLAGLASRGDGPPYYVVGREAKYRWSEVLEWLETLRRGRRASIVDGGAS